MTRANEKTAGGNRNGSIFVVGLTGQSGSGKTVVGERLAQMGCAVINADEVSRAVTSDGSECNRRLRELFPDCISEELVLDRRRLGAQVFADKEKLDLLNKTVFPYINACIIDEIARLEAGSVKLAVLDAPTLFEAGADVLCDMIVSVVADDALRTKRISERDGICAEQIADRFSSQKSKEFFIRRSDEIIENNGTLEQLLCKTDTLYCKIMERINDCR